jgi:hypothetical protein
LYNSEKNKTVILTRQFRLPTYLNGVTEWWSKPAGLLDLDAPEQCIRNGRRNRLPDY